VDSPQAQKVIESLRYGIPPDGHVSHLTVGRKEEIESLLDRLRSNDAEALLLNANYGAGKTHLLRFIREEALRNGWMVSLVTLDAKSGVRFDKLSQIVGAICRSLEVPGRERKGIRSLFETLSEFAGSNKFDHKFWTTLNSNGKWDRKKVFETEPFFLSLRAWFFCDRSIEDYIENWLHLPHDNSAGRASYIFKLLVKGMRQHFRDSRPKEYFKKEKVDLSRNDDLCWAFIRDLNLAARKIRLKGLVLCFDEFEDIIYGIARINQQKMAFCNLFDLFYEHEYLAQAYFAVTPGFVHKCKSELARKGEYDYDFSQFDELKQFEMTPISKTHLQLLGQKIVAIHSAAFKWKPPASSLNAISGIIARMSEDISQDRVRQCIRQIVTELDQTMEMR